MRLTDPHPPVAERGRELIDVDVSEYADPLYLRSIRMPFSRYMKPYYQRDTIGEHVVRRIPCMFFIPLGGGVSEDEGRRAMADEGRLVELARRASAAIPELSEGTERLIAAYEGSLLARFHAAFYEAEHDPPQRWPKTYDRTPFKPLPPCAFRPLAHPNDLLLKPGHIRSVARVLFALGWHPRHIAGLIRSKYERDFGWRSCSPGRRTVRTLRLLRPPVGAARRPSADEAPHQDLPAPRPPPCRQGPLPARARGGGRTTATEEPCP